MDPEDLIVPPVAEWSFLPEQQHAAKGEDDDENEPDEDETPADDDVDDDDDDADADKPVTAKYVESLKKRRREERATYRARLAELEKKLEKRPKDDDDEKPDLEKIRTELREELQAESHRDLRRIAAAGALEKAGIVGAGAKMVKLLDDEDLDALTVGKGGSVSGLDDLIADFKDENPSLFKKRRRDSADTGKDPDGESVRRGNQPEPKDATARQAARIREARRG